MLALRNLVHSHIPGSYSLVSFTSFTLGPCESILSLEVLKNMSSLSALCHYDPSVADALQVICTPNFNLW